MVKLKLCSIELESVARYAEPHHFPLTLQNETDKERLEQLLAEINKHIKPREETVEPDPEWLAGTGADINKKVHLSQL